MATMAACEHYSQTRSPALGRMARDAVNYIVRKQPEHGGFDVSGAASRGRADTVVTGWAIWAVQSGVVAELTVPDRTLQRFRAFLKSVRRDHGLSARRMPDSRASMAATAMATVCWTFLAQDFAETFRETADVMQKHVKKGINTRNTLVGDIEFTYLHGLAMFVMGDKHWRHWDQAVRPSLVELQVRIPNFDKDGKYITGSWDPAKHSCVGTGGRVYATAFALLCVRPPLRSSDPPME